MKNSNTRVGFFARADNGGLGCESWEFVRQMQPDKVLVIRGEHGHYPERFAGFNCLYTDGIPTHGELDMFLRDIDVLFSIETFYNWGAIPMAAGRGIKTVLRVNYEMNLNQTDPNLPVADLFLVPSPWCYDKINFDKKLLAYPVNRQVLPFKQRNTVDTFYHIAGHTTHEDRNGTQALLEVLPYIKQRKPIKIFTQSKIDFDFSPYPFVELAHLDHENYWDIHQGDCLILPRRYGGQTLQLNEALSTGAVAIMPNIEPQNTFMPKELLFDHAGCRPTVVQGGTIDCYNINPQVLAAKIDEMSEMDISGLSKWADSYAESISWDTLRPEYIKIFEEVHG